MTLSQDVWATDFSFAATETSSGMRDFLGLNSLVRSTNLLVSLAAAVSASLVHFRRTEKDTEVLGLLQFSCRERSLGERRSL